MRRDVLGVYVSRLAGGETVRAFVPAPLPPIPALDLSDARQTLLERATLALGRLDSVSLLLPDPQLFLYAYVRRDDRGSLRKAGMLFCTEISRMENP